MITASQKRLYVENGLTRFALVTVGRFEPGDSGCWTSEPVCFLNGSPSGILDGVELVIEAACQGIRDAEKDLEWPGESHVLISVQGLLVDGIDAKAARMAARMATACLIQSR